MTINGINISTLKAKVLSRNILPASKVLIREFLNDKSINPIRTKETKYQYKSIELTITINASSEEELEVLKGDISKLLSECEIVFDDIWLIYSGFLSGEIKTEMVSNTIANLSVKILALANGEDITEAINTTSASIYMPGTCETPCVVTVTPLINVISYQIDGVARNIVTKENEPIIINNLSSGMPIIINGEDCTVTEDGLNKFTDCEFWSFPSLIPGENQITLSSEQCTIQVTYKPRYI